MTSSPTAVIYVRVSDAKQADAEVSIPAQCVVLNKSRWEVQE